MSDLTDLRRLINKLATRERGGAAPPHVSLYPSFARMSLAAARYVVLATLMPNPHLAEKAPDGGGQPYWHNPPAEVKETVGAPFY